MKAQRIVTIVKGGFVVWVSGERDWKRGWLVDRCCRFIYDEIR